MVHFISHGKFTSFNSQFLKKIRRIGSKRKSWILMINTHHIYSLQWCWIEVRCKYYASKYVILSKSSENLFCLSFFAAVIPRKMWILHSHPFDLQPWAYYGLISIDILCLFQDCGIFADIYCNKRCMYWINFFDVLRWFYRFILSIFFHNEIAFKSLNKNTT